MKPGRLSRNPPDDFLQPKNRRFDADGARSRVCGNRCCVGSRKSGHNRIDGLVLPMFLSMMYCLDGSWKQNVQSAEAHSESSAALRWALGVRSLSPQDAIFQPDGPSRFADACRVILVSQMYAHRYIVSWSHIVEGRNAALPPRIQNQQHLDYSPKDPSAY